MNIFYIHSDPYIAAKAMTNKHVVKMILESAQLLSTAHLALDGVHKVGVSKTGRKQVQYEHPLKDVLYKSTHLNHPSSVWCRLTSANYKWLYDHFVALCNEYTDRYGKIHMTETKLLNVLNKLPNNISAGGLTEMPQAMDEQYRISGDSVAAYRNYYVSTKLKLQVDVERYENILETFVQRNT